MRIMALDVSTKTGWATWNSESDIYNTGLIKGGTAHGFPGVTGRFNRIGKMLTEFTTLLNNFGRPDLVIIEGYAYGVKRVSFDTVEVNSSFRYCCWDRAFAIIEVPPTRLKKFVSGKGNCKKDVILKEVYRRWGFDTDDDNVADAYGLLQFGRALLGVEEYGSTQETAVKQTLEENEKLLTSLKRDGTI